MRSPLVLYISLAVLAQAAPKTTIFLAENPNANIVLRKRSTPHLEGIVTGQSIQNHLAAVSRKYSSALSAFHRNTGKLHPSSVSTTLSKRKTGSIHLTDASSVLWYGELLVGSRTFLVDFDTGSSDLILPGPACRGHCVGHTLYQGNSKHALKSNETFSISYGDGSTIHGDVYTDVVSLAGKTAFHQALGAATGYSTNLDASKFRPDGLLGMGWPQIAVINKTTPLMNTLQKQGSLSSGEFGFKLSASGSILRLGPPASNVANGSFNSIPVKEKGFWQVDFDSVKIQGKTIVSRHSAIIDTGSTLVIADSKSASKIYRSIPGSRANSHLGKGVYTYPCDAKPSISITFGGVDYDISKSFNIGQAAKGSSECVGGIVSSENLALNAWVLGDVFLVNVYAQFSIDKATVSFAKQA